MPTTEFRAMNCRVTIHLECREPTAWTLLRPVRGWFQEWEAILSCFKPESELTVLELNGTGGVAASGKNHRTWGKNGLQHHLIDPRSGRPSQSDLI